jgi:hypothetical protein
VVDQRDVRGVGEAACGVGVGVGHRLPSEVAEPFRELPDGGPVVEPVRDVDGTGDELAALARNELEHQVNANSGGRTTTTIVAQRAKTGR